MDALKAEIERKRKAVEKTGLVSSDKKYFKRGDLAKKNAEEYIAKMRKLKGGGGADGKGGGGSRGGGDSSGVGDESGGEPSTKTRQASSSFLDDMLGDDFEKHMPSRNEV